MEDNSENVAIGKHIEKYAYRRRAVKWTQLSVGACKIDFYDRSRNVVKEVKKSSKLGWTHLVQVKYYLFMLHRHGIAQATGMIEYPKERKTEQVGELTETDFKEIRGWETEIEQICNSLVCPPLVKKKYCKGCSYFEFCYC